MSEEDLQLLITLDDPGNAEEGDTFSHLQAENTVAYWPGKLEVLRNSNKLALTFCRLARLE